MPPPGASVIARPAKWRRKAVESASVGEAQQPAAPAAGAAQLAAGARAGRRSPRAGRRRRAAASPSPERAKAAAPSTALSSKAGRGNQAWVKSGCGAVPSKATTARPRYCCTRGIEALPPQIRRPAVPGLHQLARVVDPDLRLRLGADPGVDQGLLVAPLRPAVARGGAEREAAGLVVIERREAVLALAEAPFLRAGAVRERASRPGPADRQAVVAQAERQQRQAVEAAAEAAAAPEQAGDGGELDDQPSRSECS